MLWDYLVGACFGTIVAKPATISTQVEIPGAAGDVVTRLCCYKKLRQALLERLNKCLRGHPNLWSGRRRI